MTAISNPLPFFWVSFCSRASVHGQRAVTIIETLGQLLIWRVFLHRVTFRCLYLLNFIFFGNHIWAPQLKKNEEKVQSQGVLIFYWEVKAFFWLPYNKISGWSFWEFNGATYISESHSPCIHKKIINTPLRAAKVKWWVNGYLQYNSWNNIFNLIFKWNDVTICLG